MTTHATTAPATPTPPNPAGSARSGNVREFFDVYGKRAIFLLLGFIVLLWIGVKYSRMEDEAKKQQAQAMQQQQAQAVLVHQEAVRQTKVCGANGEPACTCKGVDTVTRYLRPRQAALLRVDGEIDFFPAPSPQTFVLCDPEDRTRCVNGRDKDLHVGLMLLVKNVSDRTQNIACEQE